MEPAVLSQQRLVEIAAAPTLLDQQAIEQKLKARLTPTKSILKDAVERSPSPFRTGVSFPDVEAGPLTASGEFVFHLRGALNLTALSKSQITSKMWCSISAYGGVKYQSQVVDLDSRRRHLWNVSYNIKMYSSDDTITVKIYNHDLQEPIGLVHSFSFSASNFNSTPTVVKQDCQGLATLIFRGSFLPRKPRLERNSSDSKLADNRQLRAEQQKSLRHSASDIIARPAQSMDAPTPVLELPNNRWSFRNWIAGFIRKLPSEDAPSQSPTMPATDRDATRSDLPRVPVDRRSSSEPVLSKKQLSRPRRVGQRLLRKLARRKTKSPDGAASEPQAPEKGLFASGPMVDISKPSGQPSPKQQKKSPKSNRRRSVSPKTKAKSSRYKTSVEPTRLMAAPQPITIFVS
eukprot:c9338_g1_i2.p1 GENE.c9338_g1_i2~~c9338_g1_i2.p1  ORF type:complete len:413 (+),score=74.32 c9338_g1_i2:31-1239(+)